MRRLAAVATVLTAALLLTSCSSAHQPSMGAPGPSHVDVGSKALVALKKQTHVPDCPHAGKAAVTDGMPSVTLPGVGRKTANVVLGNGFGVPGITVDTHFGRLARRFGWTEETDPVKVEHAVGALFDKRDWVMLCHHLIWHGRRVCHAKKPACGACPVARWCPSYGEGPVDADAAGKLVRIQGPA